MSLVAFANEDCVDEASASTPTTATILAPSIEAESQQKAQNRSKKRFRFVCLMTMATITIIVIANAVILCALIILFAGNVKSQNYPQQQISTPSLSDQTNQTSRSTSASTQAIDSIETFQCPTDMFRCEISTKIDNQKFNYIYRKSQPKLSSLQQQQPQQQQPQSPSAKIFGSHVTLSRSNPKITLMCIDNWRVCDGTPDCPAGDDELEANCLDKTSTITPIVTTTMTPTEEPENEIGCYRCAGDPDRCISMARVCDHRIDCPNGDDEHRSLCGNIPLSSSSSSSSNQSIKSGLSTFSANQYAPTNITIINKAYHREFSEDRNPIESGDGVQIGLRQNDNNLSQKSNDSEGTGGVHNGVGFMFRVDNMIIYNSQVKMFNQNSENISPNQNASTPNNDESYQQPNYPNYQPPNYPNNQQANYPNYQQSNYLHYQQQQQQKQNDFYNQEKALPQIQSKLKKFFQQNLIARSTRRRTKERNELNGSDD